MAEYYVIDKQGKATAANHVCQVESQKAVVLEIDLRNVYIPQVRAAGKDKGIPCIVLDDLMDKSVKPKYTVLTFPRYKDWSIMASVFASGGVSASGTLLVCLYQPEFESL